MNKRKILSLQLLLILEILMISCSEKPEEYALIFTEKGKILLRFFPDKAPKHVESFKILAREGFFDGTNFHRVISGFVIQGGDSNSKDGDRLNDGQGGRAGKYYGFGDKKSPDTWTIPAEFNERPHKKGTLSMARSPQDNDSAGSQFFICLDSLPDLDGKYTVFGEVVQGMDTVEKIANILTPRKRNPYYSRPDKDSPIRDVFMEIKIGTEKELELHIPSD